MLKIQMLKHIQIYPNFVYKWNEASRENDLLINYILLD